MEITLVNHSSLPLPRKWVKEVLVYLHRNLKVSDLTVVFLNPPEAKKLNKAFRKKNYATDILSFPSGSMDTLGELVLCPQVLKKQALEHSHSFKAELAYMLIHGVLHLVGHEHEGTSSAMKKKAKLMFRIQDQLFDRLCKKYDL